MCLSSSNSAVERVLSILTLMLSDRRFTMNHTTMEDANLITANRHVWSDKEQLNTSKQQDAPIRKEDAYSNSSDNEDVMMIT